MSTEAIQRIMNVAIDLPDEAEDPVVNFMVSFKNPEEPAKKPFRRQLGALKNKDFYMTPGFDSCIDDDPAAFGLEEYV